jgi:cyclophilin family peptidyl-prolyl cis-trans isomerase
MTFRLLFPLVAACLLSACQPDTGAPSAPPATGNPKVPAGAKSSGGRHAVLQLEKGEIELELLPEAAPRAVENFRLLAEHGYYDELEPASPLYRAGYRRGIVAMANRGPNTNTSQFFIMHQDYRLPPSYVIFAKVIRGFEVVDALAELPTVPGLDGSASVPRQPPVIRRIIIKP